MSDVSAIRRRRWPIIAVALLLALIVVGVVYYQEIGVWVFARGLYGKDEAKAQSAGRRLAALGRPGRRALLRALREGDAAPGTPDVHILNRVPLRAAPILAQALREDLKNGRSIEPIVREAIAGIDLPGDVGVRMAAVASEGWVPGLLDDATKRRIVARCVKVRIEARPEYPVHPQPEGEHRTDEGHRIGCPWAHFREEGLSRALSFNCERYSGTHPQAPPEGAWLSGGSGMQWPSDQFQPIPRAVARTGRQTAYARLRVKLTGYREERPIPGGIASQTSPLNGPPWSMEIEAMPVSFDVVENVPDDYLKAKTTPRLDAEVRGTVGLSSAKAGKNQSGTTTSHLHRKTDAGDYAYTHSVSYAKHDLPVVCLYHTLPVDLTFRARWHVVKLNQTFDCSSPFKWGRLRKASGFVVVPKGHTEELLQALTEPGEHNLAIRITLEPSLDAALSFPEIDGYWPGTIELPEKTVRFKVSKSQKEAEVSP